MRIYFILFLIIKLVVSVQYNQQCKFSFGTCNWSIGRRWHIVNLDDNNKVLIADGESKEDKRVGFTDAIMSSWLHLSPLCSFDIRLTFQFSIQNEYDRIEIYLIEKNRTRMSSIGQWKGIINTTNTSEDIEPIWQLANVTFKATEEFRIDIEVRHLPDHRNNSVAWFAIDDILIENCPIAIVNTTSRTSHATETTTTIPPIPSTTTRFRSNESNFALTNTSHWKLDDLPEENPSSSSRLTLLTLILYLLCALIALTLLIILFAIIIFTYRKHCLSSSSSSTPIIDHGHRLNKNKLNNRVGIQIENIEHDNQIAKTMETTVRPCF